MNIPPKGTTNRRILDQLYQSDISFEALARIINDISKPAIRKVLQTEVDAGRIRRVHRYELTQEARKAYIAEQQPVAHVRSFKPWTKKPEPYRREGSMEFMTWPSKHV
jgi:DNA-binding HxlR family transcriptional regulator